MKILKFYAYDQAAVYDHRESDLHSIVADYW